MHKLRVYFCSAFGEIFVNYSKEFQVFCATLSIERCGAVRYGAVRCGTVRYGAVRCGTVRYGAVRYGTVRYGTVRQIPHMVSRQSAVGIATYYGLDGPNIESRLGRHFPHPFRPAVGTTQPPIQRARAYFPG
jgi:hypothetical protein